MKNYRNWIKRLALGLFVVTILGGCVVYGDGRYNDGWWGGGDRGDHRDRDRGDHRGGDRDGDRGGERR